MEIEIEIDGKSIAIDAEGYLTHMGQWEPCVAEAMASADKVELTPAHWTVINLLREYYAEYRIAPPVRVILKILGAKLGADKAKHQYLYSLFPNGPGKQACRYAGLPKPSGCV